MAHTQDFIPGRDGDFDGWLSNLISYAEGKVSAGAWKHVPAEKLGALKTLAGAWHAAFQKISGPHTAVDTGEKKAARKEAEKCVRPFIAQYLKFDPVNDEDRIAMRLRNRDGSHTAVGAPASRALITALKALGGFQVAVTFHDENAPSSRAVPYGYNGALLNYAWGPQKLEGYAALSSTALMTRSRFVLKLPPEAEGAFLSCAARWQNKKGELGPWGEINHVAVA